MEEWFCWGDDQVTKLSLDLALPKDRVPTYGEFITLLARISHNGPPKCSPTFSHAENGRTGPPTSRWGMSVCSPSTTLWSTPTSWSSKDGHNHLQAEEGQRRILTGYKLNSWQGARRLFVKLFISHEFNYFDYAIDFKNFHKKRVFILQDKKLTGLLLFSWIYF